MHTRPPLTTALALSLCSTLFAAPSLSAQPGRLVIIGGGLSDTTSAVYRAILDARQGGGPVCVIPTAGATPETAMERPVRTFEKHGGAGSARGVLISMTQPETARAAETVAQLRQCGGFYFIGGVQSRITAALLPKGEGTPALETIRQRWRDGAVIAGSSAGAAIMSDPMIAGGTSAGAFTSGLVRREDMADDEESTPGMVVSRGLGFFPAALADQHFLARGRFGRLLVAMMELSTFDLAFGIDENTALVVDGDTLHTTGASGVTVFDAREARRTERAYEGITMHLMGAGDRFVLSSRRYEAAGDKQLVANTGAAVPADTNIFAPWAFLRSLDAFGRSTTNTVSWTAPGGTIAVRKTPTFRATARSGTGVRGAAAGLGLTGLRVDVVRDGGR